MTTRKKTNVAVEETAPEEIDRFAETRALAQANHEAHVAENEALAAAEKK